MTFRNNVKKEIRFVGDGLSLQRYLREIAKSKTISAAEEAELAKRIRLDDRQALNKLICANLKFVVSVCWNYRNQGLSMPDLINEGNLGLIRAARRFDESKQFKFISYAVWWIRQSILQALGEQSRLVKLPFSRIQSLQKIHRAGTRLEQKLGRTPSPQEVSESLGQDADWFVDNVKVSQTPLSLDAPLSGEDNIALLDMMEDGKDSDPENLLMEQDLQRRVQTALKTLSPKEEMILRMHYGIGIGTHHSLEEIGARFGLTRERVRQIKERALNKLKHARRYRALSIYAEG